MEIETMKTVNLVSYLSALGYKCAKVTGNQYWYHSPIHEEKTPSFKVNSDRNLWYDFALNKGGNIINLVKELHPMHSMHQALLILESQINRYGLQYENRLTSHINQTIQSPKRQSLVTDNTVVTQIIALSHPNLLYYLKQRRIDLSVAQKYCKEVHYTMLHTDKHYYGIAFFNIQLGMEVRNKFCKRCIGKKSYSYIVTEPGQMADDCCVFEGFFDFLTYMTFKQWKDIGLCLNKKCDYIILNSVSSIRKTFEELNSYQRIHTFLDNDRAGRDGTEMIKKQFQDRVIDESHRYEGYKDINDVLLGQPILEP